MTRLVRSFRRRPLETLGLVLAVTIVAIAIVGPALITIDPVKLDFRAQLQPPSGAHLLGTDDKGRDILSRLLSGSRITLSAVAAVIALATVIGVVVGTIAALAGGWVDEALMRVTDVGLALPSLVLALGIAASLGSGIGAAIVALAVTWWPGYARLVRSMVMNIATLDHVAAARVLGVRGPGLVVRHILPGTFEVLLVQMAIDVAAVTLVISGLSFIGVGAQPPTPEWGAMIADGRGYMQRAPWVVLFPGLAIVSTAVAFSLTGDLFRSSLDDPTVVRQG